MVNWLKHLTIVRNICAHHERLWHRQHLPAAHRRLRALETP
ncbi:Abi family protein [Gordonia sp. (in: high G+C Gram-positive bacteria)]